MLPPIAATWSPLGFPAPTKERKEERIRDADCRHPRRWLQLLPSLFFLTINNSQTPIKPSTTAPAIAFFFLPQPSQALVVPYVGSAIATEFGYTRSIKDPTRLSPSISLVFLSRSAVFVLLPDCLCFPSWLQLGWIVFLYPIKPKKRGNTNILDDLSYERGMSSNKSHDKFPKGIRISYESNSRFKGKH
ncbi:unnamed protein product [Lactuca virosa]|uniref:Uncharacterized protein n=1 Tax=Lactuca virosa TaxID=75947 RepID=A0AAU9N0T8_9ASTR|nr:unnamed protein product [Lactuca virosa]